MDTPITATTLARKLWLNTALVLSTGIFIYSLFSLGPASFVQAFALLLLLLYKLNLYKIKSL